MKNNFHLKQSSPEVSEHFSQKILKAQHTILNQIQDYIYSLTSPVYFEKVGVVLYSRTRDLSVQNIRFFFLLKSFDK